MPKKKSLDLKFEDLGELNEREYDLLRIGALTTILGADKDPNINLSMPGIFRQAFENELTYRTQRVRG